MPPARYPREIVRRPRSERPVSWPGPRTDARSLPAGTEGIVKGNDFWDLLPSPPGGEGNRSNLNLEVLAVLDPHELAGLGVVGELEARGVPVEFFAGEPAGDVAEQDRFGQHAGEGE